jgi:NADP-dependent 3-hydroxy acid dehydrogenase YdfG
MLITIIGAGAGISRAVAEIFGQKGFKIAVISRSEEKLKKMVHELNGMGIKSTYAIADAGDEVSLTEALDSIHEAQGLSDIILYNAFAYNMKPLATETWESVKHQLDVNAGGAFHVLKSMLPKFKERNSGKLFFTGGGLGIQPMPRTLALGIGKAALRNMIQAVVPETRGTNVHIAMVTVCGFVKPDDPKYNPRSIAEQYWKLHEQQSGSYETEVMY